MFNPRQPRDTGGQWVRLGRGELEEMIDALVQPRASHIARVNGRYDEKHVQVVKRDIRARVLKPMRVAPAYVVRVRGVANGRPVVEAIPAGELKKPGANVGVKAVIPHEKRNGNVDVVEQAMAAIPSEQVVNKQQFAATLPSGNDTIGVRKKMADAIVDPRNGGGATGVGLTDVARRVARKKRAKVAPADTVEGGSVMQKREIEAAVAAKHIKKAQGDRLRAILMREPPAPGANVDDYWESKERKLLRMRAPKADRDAVAAMREHLGGGPVIRSGGAGIDRPVERLLGDMGLGDGRRRALAQLFRDHPRRDGELDTYAYVKRVRQAAAVKLAQDGGLLADFRRLRTRARDNQGRAVREARPGGADFQGRGMGGAAPQLGVNTKPADASTPFEQAVLDGELIGVKYLGGGINGTFTAKINGHKVVVKPGAGEMDGVRGGAIPRGGGVARERGAWLVAQKLGMDNCPEVIIRDTPAGQAAVMRFLDGAHNFGHGNLNADGQAGKDIRALALLDGIIANTDRHGGNFMKAGGRVYHIDGGLSFPKPMAVGGNMALVAHMEGKPLSNEEISKLRAMLSDADFWTKMERDVGIDATAVSACKRRIEKMLNTGKFLPKHGLTNP